MSKAIKWLENYWYHYKWHTLIVLFFAVTLIIVTVQMINKDNPDVMLLYAGPATINADQRAEMEHAVELVMGKDHNGDGEKDAMLNSIELLTDAQVEAARKEYQDRGEEFLFNGAVMAQNRETFTRDIFMGQQSICLLDPYWYELVRENDGFLELSEVLGYTPDGAVDGYCVRLRDTGFGSYFTAFHILPEDTVICFRRESYSKNEAVEEQYTVSKQIFRDIMQFEAP